MIVIVKIIWLLDKDWITNHLGKNPKKGGRPPKDRRDTIKNTFSIKKSEINEKDWLIWKSLKEWNIKIKVKERNL